MTGPAPVPGLAPGDPPGPRTRRPAGERAKLAALAPARDAMLRQASEQAAEIVRQARRQAQEAIGQARRDAAAQVRSAAEAGRSQAVPLAAAVRNRGRRDARTALLSAQREAYEELCARVRAAVSALRDDPGYGQLAERLRRDAGRAAGPGAVVTEAPAGGVVARGPGTVVDCSLPRLADAAVAALGDQLAWLWTPGRRREGS
jgi:vacuolar-type H+-ATPase subunit E/Vma4